MTNIEIRHKKARLQKKQLRKEIIISVLTGLIVAIGFYLITIMLFCI